MKLLLFVVTSGCCFVLLLCVVFCFFCFLFVVNVLLLLLFNWGCACEAFHCRHTLGVCLSSPCCLFYSVLLDNNDHKPTFLNITEAFMTKLRLLLSLSMHTTTWKENRRFLNQFWGRAQVEKTVLIVEKMTKILEKAQDLWKMDHVRMGFKRKHKQSSRPAKKNKKEQESKQ